MSSEVDAPWFTGPTETFQNYANAFKAGQGLADDRTSRNALAAYAMNPNAPINPAMAAADPTRYFQMQDRTQAQGDRQSNIQAATSLAAGNPSGAASALAQTGNYKGVGDINDEQTKATATFQDQFRGVIHSLAIDPDVGDRLNKIQHIVASDPRVAAVLQHAGIDPTKLTADQVSTGNLMQLFQALGGGKEAEAGDKPQVVGKDSQLLFGPNSLGGAQQPTDPNAPPGAAPVSTQPSSVAPQDRDAMTRAIMTEAGGEGPEGQAAVGHVIMNRVNANYGGASTVSSVVHAPKQFEGMTSSRANVDQSDPGYQNAQKVADAVLGGQTTDPTNGATQFLNPVLQSNLGRAQPAWATGQGQKIGNHVFYGGKPGDGSYQVASNSQTPPPPSGRTSLGGGYTLVSPNGGDTASNGHVSTAAELKAAGLPATAQGWTDAKGEIKPLSDKFSANPGGGSGDSTKTGADYMASLQPAQRALVQGVIDGRMPLPANPRTPAQFSLAQDVALADPGFNSATFKQNESTYLDMFSTKGKTAQSLRSMSTAMDHAGTLSDMIDKLGNNDTPLIGGAINSVKNAFDPNSRSVSSQMGPLIQQLSIEAASAAQGGTPHEAEVQGYLKTLKDPSSQPTEQRGALMGIVSALYSRYNEIQSSYDRSKSPAGTPFAALSPDALQSIKKIAALQGRLSGGALRPAPQPNQRPAQGGGQVLNWTPDKGVH